MYFDVFNGSVAVNHTLSTRQVHYKLFNEGSARIKVVETRRGWGFIKEIGLDAHEEFDLSGYTSDTTSYEIYLTSAFYRSFCFSSMCFKLFSFLSIFRSLLF